MKLKKYASRKGIGIKWVSDFRDAWTGYLSTPDRWSIPSRIDKRYERETLRFADAITVVANGIKEDFIDKYPRISKNKKFYLIRNGFDSNDYININPDKKKNEKFTVVYTGSMYGKRNPYFLLNTVTDLANSGKLDIGNLKFIFVGRCGSEILEYIDISPLKSSIELIPYVPHAESINYLLKADAMLLLIDEDKYSKMILSGKVYEYLGASLITGKPILAIAPKGEAAELIRETSSGDIIHHNNRDALSKVFLKYYNSFFENKNTSSINPEAVKQYDRKFLTQKLSEVFNQITEKRN
jgi:hypothetical protein